MSWVMYLLLAVAIGTAIYLAARIPWRMYRRFRGTRVVTCPETQEPVAVHVNAAHAAMTSSHGAPDLTLKTCTRWPERQDCGQECLAQIEQSPEDCLVRTMVTRWYQGKSCVYCGRSLGEISWTEHKPALLPPGKAPVQWSSIPAEKLSEVFETHQPVCWDCFVSESLRMTHPELVTDRGARSVPRQGGQVNPGGV